MEETKLIQDDVIASQISSEDKVKIWEKIINVQEHFNEIKSKNQTLFISVITAALVATGYIFQKDSNTVYYLNLYFFKLPIYFFTMPIIGALFFVGAFYILECHIYHVLLKGSVDCGKKFEKEVLGINLTSNVIEENSEDKNFLGIRGAGKKLKAFYISIFAGLIAIFLMLNLLYVKHEGKISSIKTTVQGTSNIKFQPQMAKKTN